MHRLLHIPRDEDAPATARRALDTMPLGLDAKVLESSRLLLSELVTNSVRHGAGDEVRIALLSRDDGGLRCEVVDCGDGFDPSRTVAADHCGGWGLQLVEAVADRWGVSEGSTHVWFELRPERRRREADRPDDLPRIGPAPFGTSSGQRAA